MYQVFTTYENQIIAYPELYATQYDATARILELRDDDPNGFYGVRKAESGVRFYRLIAEFRGFCESLDSVHMHKEVAEYDFNETKSKVDNGDYQGLILAEYVTTDDEDGVEWVQDIQRYGLIGDKYYN